MDAPLHTHIYTYTHRRIHTCTLHVLGTLDARDKDGNTRLSRSCLSNSLSLSPSLSLRRASPSRDSPSFHREHRDTRARDDSGDSGDHVSSFSRREKGKERERERERERGRERERRDADPGTDVDRGTSRRDAERVADVVNRRRRRRRDERAKRFPPGIA